jgi:hypothetical protein
MVVTVEVKFNLPTVVFIFFLAISTSDLLHRMYRKAAIFFGGG